MKEDAVKKIKISETKEEFKKRDQPFLGNKGLLVERLLSAFRRRLLLVIKISLIQRRVIKVRVEGR